ncbi:diguanylate cyclase [Myxococcota bacterium]|nr:diguanylate cyclase [Myxococcota bacterium]
MTAPHRIPTPTAAPAPRPRPALERSILRTGAIIAFGWTLLIAAAAFLNYQNNQWDAFQHARSVANAYIDKDLAVRRWVAGHGGVYVPPSERTPPNEWLTVPERDVSTRDGKALTLVNPAYATRQLQEDFAASHGIQSHLTSLVLKNPNNTPTAWERSALERLAAGSPNVVESDTSSDREYLRLMRPVYMEQSCMKCHSDMNIPVGGLRGGITASVPMAPYRTEHQRGLTRAMLSHLGLWFIGLLGIAFTTRRYEERSRERTRALTTAQRDDRRIAEVLTLSERLDVIDEREIIQQGLEASVRLTDSKIGYFHFVNEDQNTIELVTWSKDTLASYCTAAYDNHYPIEKAGIWADCARLHQPVVHNDYPNHPIKRGLPEGHAPLSRHMSVPVIEGGRVRIVTGVGNKALPYDDDDLRLVQLLANDVWKLVQRKRADTALRASEQRLREAQSVAGMGSWRLDHGTREIVWSDQMYVIFGVDPTTFVPGWNSVGELIHPDDQAAAGDAFEKAIELQRPFDYIGRVRRPDGGIRLVHFRAVTEFTPDDKPSSTLGMAHDVTEAHEVERLRRSTAELTAVFEHTDRMIWMLDLERRLVVANPVFLSRFERHFGRPARLGEPQPGPEVPPASAQVWRDLYQRGLAGEQFTAQVEGRSTTGAVTWLGVTVHPVVDDLTGHVTGVNVTAVDITERRRLEEAQQNTLVQMRQVVQQLEAHHQRAIHFQRLNDLLQSCRTEAEACEVVSLAAPDILHGHPGSLALAPPGQRDLIVMARWGAPAGDDLDLFGVDDCWALRRGELHTAQRPGDLHCKHFGTTAPNAYFCLSLVVRGETLGLLTVEFLPSLPPEGVAELQDAARTMAGTIKLGVSNLRLRLALEEQAVHDALTGLFNRRYLDLTLPRELHRAERAGSKVTVAMLDIDHFKRFNDTLGHEAGDLVLRSLGQLLLRRLRKSDIGCRYGGEELLLILPESDATGARERLAGLCDEIRNTALQFHGRPLPAVTVSVGIACTERVGYDAHTLTRLADEALYAAKQGGRDRIVVHGDL